MLLINIPAEIQFLPSMNLRNRWSINVAVYLFKLCRVGKVILGNNPFVINTSKYSWNLIRSLTEMRF